MISTTSCRLPGMGISVTTRAPACFASCPTLPDRPAPAPAPAAPPPLSPAPLSLPSLSNVRPVARIIFTVSTASARFGTLSASASCA